MLSGFLRRKMKKEFEYHLEIHLVDKKHEDDFLKKLDEEYSSKYISEIVIDPQETYFFRPVPNVIKVFTNDENIPMMLRLETSGVKQFLILE